MRKSLILAYGFVLLFAALFFVPQARAQIATPNLKLQLPPRGTFNWDSIMNQNFTVLDTFAGTTQALYQGVWSAAAVYSKGQFVQSSGILYMSLLSTNLNNVPAASPFAWQVVLAPGTVTSVSAGGLTPLFTTGVSNTATTPAISFTLSNAAAHTYFGNNSGSTGAPAFFNIALLDLPGSGAVTVNTTAPLGGGGSVNLGGTLTLTCGTCAAFPAPFTAGNVLRANGTTFVSAALAAADLSDGTTGSGALARAASPSFTTPALGNATAFSIVLNGAATGTGASLTSGGTGATTGGGLSIFNGAAGAANEMLAVYPADSAAAATRMFALSIRNLSAGFLSGSQVAGIDHTGVATGITLDAEGTGNVITIPIKIWLPAAGCNNATASTFWDLPTATPAAPACVTGTNTQKGVLDYADTTGGFSAQTTELLPADWSGTVDARIIWFTTATTGNVKWSLSTICTSVSAAAVDDPAFNTASTVTTAAPGTTNQIQTSSITTVTVTGCSAGQLLHIKLFRDGNDAADTIAATARLYGVEITLRRAM